MLKTLSVDEAAGFLKLHPVTVLKYAHHVPSFAAQYADNTRKT